MTIALLLAAALALPCRAVISHGEAPEPGPSGPIHEEFPTASVTGVPSALSSLAAPLSAPDLGAEPVTRDFVDTPAQLLESFVPQPLPAALSASARPQGEAAVGQGLTQTAATIAPSVEAVRKGGDSDAAAAGASIQNALQGAAEDRPGGLGPIEVKIYSDVKPPVRDPRELSLETSGAFAASYRYAYASAGAAAKAQKLGNPRFVEAWREKDGWQLHFVAGGRHVRVYARDGHQPADRAWVGSEWKPESSLGLTPPRLSQKIGPAPRYALNEAARRFGAPAETLGLSIWTLPKSNSLWYVVDAEDGRRVAFNTLSGNARKLERSEVTRERVEASVRALAGHKGYPFSQTEYNASYAGYVDMLRQDGATRAQLSLFARLAAELPIRGGRFNSWSGD